MAEAAKLDAAAKQRVKDALKSHISSQVGASDQAVATERSGAELDQDASHSVDDLSQSDEAGELHELLEAAEDKQRADLAAIDELDFGPKEVVEPGAIVSFGGDHFVFGVVADAFDCDGVSYEGISADSPVGQVIEGLSAGETFAFNEQTHRLDLVC